MAEAPHAARASRERASLVKDVKFLQTAVIVLAVALLLVGLVAAYYYGQFASQGKKITQLQQTSQQLQHELTLLQKGKKP